MKEIGYKPLRFFIKIILPSIITIILFILSFIVFILPEFEHNVMERKREMIRELTNTTWSILQKFEKEVKDSSLSVDKAQQMAQNEIRNIRYGDEKKDYFWITDLSPRMVMHPYRDDLEGKMLDNFQDYQGKKMFVEMANIVKKNDEGYVEYIWQWKDDPKQKVPKISYVKIFKPWGWIIGTGIYIQDVKEEINKLEKNLLIISFFVVLMSMLLLTLIVIQGHIIEKKRIEAENKLLESHDKYKTLIESTTDGIILLDDNSITFSNFKIQKLTGYSSLELLKININQLFIRDAKQIIDFQKEGTYELEINTKKNLFYDVIVNIVPIKYLDKKATLISVKDVTETNTFFDNNIDNQIIDVDEEKNKIIYELQAQNSYNYVKIKEIVEPLIFCKSTDTAIQVIEKIIDNKSKAILVRENNLIIGMITKNDLLKICLKSNSNQLLAYQIMTSPILSISEDATVGETILFFKLHKINTLAITNSQNEYIGFVFFEELSKNIYHTNDIFYQQIHNSESDIELRKIQKKLSVFIAPLVFNGINQYVITELTTKVADEITKKIIQKAIKQIGEPPVRFAFIILGSQARFEQTISTDQDNAIIYENPTEENKKEVQQYFINLGNYICNLLNYSGYAFCKGNIMAKNDKWCQPIDVWQNYYKEWILNYEPQTILDFSIFLDFRNIYGDINITNQLREYVKNQLDNNPNFLFQLAQNLISFKPPIGIFGKIILKNEGNNFDTFDIKQALQPILLFARLYSLQNNLSIINTIDRIKLMVQQKYITNAMANEIIFSYNFLMQIRIKHQLNQLFSSQITDNYINYKQISDIEKTIIKKIFISYSILFNKVKNEYKGIV